MKNILSLLLFTFIFIRSAYSVSFFKLNQTDGLSHPAVISICQDELGRMWLGTREGVNIFDGQKIFSYKGKVAVPNGRQFNLGGYVSILKSDTNKNIYLLSDYNLFLFNPRTSQSAQLTEGNSTSVFTIEKDTVWYIQNDSLKRFQINSHTHQNENIAIPSGVTAIEKHNNVIYVGNNKNLYLITKDTICQVDELKGKRVNCLFKSSFNEIWIGTSKHGIYKYTNNQLEKIPETTGFRSENVRDFTEDKEGNIWIGTKDGLYKYDRKSNKFSFINTPHYLGGLKHSAVYSLFCDNQGNIWIGTFNEGVSYFNPEDNDFVNYTYQGTDPLSGKFKYIKDLVLDKYQHLWIGTIADGVTCLDTNWNIIKRLNTQSKDKLPSDHIEDLVYDEKKNQLYIAMLSGGLSIYELESGKLSHYSLPKGQTREQKGETLYHLELWNNQLFMSSTKSIYRFDFVNHKFIHITDVSSYCWDFKINETGTVFARHENNLKVFSLNNPNQSKIVKIGKKISSLILGDKGVYVLTLGKGVLHYNVENNKITQYNTDNNSLPTDYCYQCTRTDNKNYVITCAEGIILFNPTSNTFKLIDKYKKMNTILNESGILAIDSENILVGGSNGILKIDISKSHKNKIHNSKIVFSDLFINNEQINPNSKQSILTKSLPFTSCIYLKSHENNILIKLKNIDLTRQHNQTEYLYKIEGIDKEWNKTTNQSIHIVNILPGKYSLKAKMDTSDNAPVSSLDIIIDYPIYARWWAICIYISIFTFIVYIIYRYQSHQRSLKISLINEKFEKRQIERLNQEKLTFFTNVSHEFRTPLTLIISHLDSLLEQENVPTTIYSSIYKIKKNAQYMNNLVSELLDFRKFSQNSFVLSVSENDYVTFLQEMYLSFSDMAQSRKISFDFLTNCSNIKGYFDVKQMEKVFFNLLSNAFKYTPQNGKITIKINQDKSSVFIIISDTGIGIDKEEIKHLFNRFFQGNNQQGQEQTPGTGIGLALTKTILDNHHGNIHVESEKEKGSTFYVQLPLNKEVFDNDKNVKFVETDTDRDAGKENKMVYQPAYESLANNYEELEEDETEEKDSIKRTILIVEDNPELLTILKNIFKEQYQVLLASNGKEGLEQTFNFKPDLIISDIMMPIMNGTEMCLKIKNNIDLCHIPIILLTALSSEQQNIEGLNRGADDYISKPFNAKILHARVNSLIRNRLLIQTQINKRPIDEVDLTSINPIDQKILKKAEQVLINNFENPEFSVLDLCSELAMGRSLLFTKFKELTGMTPYKYILNFRLKHAAGLLLTHPEMTITEISDYCGFSSSVHFSRCFKNQYGVSPQNYKKKEN